MSKKYTVRIHLAQGVVAETTSVDEKFIDQYRDVLKKENSIIEIDGQGLMLSNKKQFVPVRNILAVEFEEEPEG